MSFSTISMRPSSELPLWIPSSRTSHCSKTKSCRRLTIFIRPCRKWRTTDRTLRLELERPRTQRGTEEEEGRKYGGSIALVLPRFLCETLCPLWLKPSWFSQEYLPATSA